MPIDNLGDLPSVTLEEKMFFLSETTLSIAIYLYSMDVGNLAAGLGRQEVAR